MTLMGQSEGIFKECVTLCECVCLFSTEGACNQGQCIINTVSRRCTIILDKPPGPAIRNITIPATHQKYTCTMKENTGFLSSQQWRLQEWKALGSQWGLSTCRKKVGLLSNARLIKLWCVPSPCRSMPFLLFPPHLQPRNAPPACPITLNHVFVLFRLSECVFLIVSIKASTLASKWPLPL